MELKKYYKQSFELIKEAKWFIVFSFLLFCIFFVFGFSIQIFPVQIKELLKSMALQFQGLNTFQTIYKIFFNNGQASFFSIFIGICFGYISIFSSLFNGYISGFVGREATNIEGLSVLLRLLPHGIFELTAIFISIGLGIFLANKFIEKELNVKDKNKRFLIIGIISFIMIPIQFITFLNINKFVSTLYSLIVFISMIFVLFRCIKNKVIKQYMSRSIIMFFLIVIPLLLFAAIIEGLLMSLWP